MWRKFHVLVMLRLTKMNVHTTTKSQQKRVLLALLRNMSYHFWKQNFYNLSIQRSPLTCPLYFYSRLICCYNRWIAERTSISNSKEVTNRKNFFQDSRKIASLRCGVNGLRKNYQRKLREVDAWLQGEEISQTRIINRGWQKPTRIGTGLLWWRRLLFR